MSRETNSDAETASNGAAPPTPASDAEPDGLAERRLLYAERCENLIEALQFVSSVLRKTSAGGNDAREAVARRLSEELPPEELEAAFERIDAMWAAWNRPDTSSRSRDAVQRHARVAILAAVDQTVKILRLSKVARALAGQRAGRALDAAEEALLASQADAVVAAELLAGRPQLVATLCGELEYHLDEAAQAAGDAEPQRAPELVRWLVRANGYPDLATKLTDTQAEELVRVWPKHAGRPRGGEQASWDAISALLADLGLGRSKNVRKDFEAFRRESGMAPSARS